MGKQPPPLSLRDIVVHRGGFALAIDQLSLAAGQIACVVGPNGGGKTTLLLTTLGLLPHTGQVQVCGEVYDGTQPHIKARLGYVPDDPELLFDELTAREYWGLTASMLAKQGRGARDDLLQRAEQLAQGLAFDPPPKLIAAYSHGMRKKTQLVNALLGAPPVLVIDELRNGLDPIAIAQSETLVRAQQARGVAILVATHDLWWAERFADYIYILHQGRLAAAGTCKQLLGMGEKHLEQAFLRIVASAA